MKRITILILGAVAMSGFTLDRLQALESGVKSADNPNGCKVVERKSGDKSPSGSMTSSVTAGGGKVSGYTTGADNSITVHSGNGTTSSSVATAGGSGNSTVVAGSGSGDCTIFVDPGRKKK